MKAELNELDGRGFGIAIGWGRRKLRRVYLTVLFWKWDFSLFGSKNLSEQKAEPIQAKEKANGEK